MSDHEALLSSASLGRRHHVLTGTGYQMLALGIQNLNLGVFQGTKTEQKLLDYSGARKLSKEEVS